ASLHVDGDRGRSYFPSVSDHDVIRHRIYAMKAGAGSVHELIPSDRLAGAGTGAAGTGCALGDYTRPLDEESKSVLRRTRDRHCGGLRIAIPVPVSGIGDGGIDSRLSGACELQLSHNWSGRVLRCVCIWSFEQGPKPVRAPNI